MQFKCFFYVQSKNSRHGLYTSKMKKTKTVSESVWQIDQESNLAKWKTWSWNKVSHANVHYPEHPCSLHWGSLSISMMFHDHNPEVLCQSDWGLMSTTWGSMFITQRMWCKNDTYIHTNIHTSLARVNSMYWYHSNPPLQDVPVYLVPGTIPVTHPCRMSQST